MPIFEYRCRACREEFEKLVRSSSQEVACPRCGSGRVEKKLSAFGCRTSSGFTSSTGGSGCGGCTSSNCSSCG
jgi:putative FmdB family regulatory protein